MSSGPHDLVLFLGRFHPMLVHLPIGGLVLLGVLELLARFRRFKNADRSNRLILGLTAATAIVTALLGWMLSHAGGYDPQLLRWHKWTGFGVAAACALTWMLNRLEWSRSYRFSLAATLALLMVSSHFGASITHGRGFLTQYAPRPLRVLLGAQERPAALHRVPVSLAQQHVFSDIIQPILERRCITCHGPEKRKAGLSFEGYDAALKGGKDGPVLVAGKPLDSPMIHRLLLPPDDDDHMPPDGKPQPTLAEIAALEWWIEHGAPADKTVADLKPVPEVRHILEAARAAAK